MLKRSVAEVVCNQAECGIDIVTDGEFSNPGFFTYIRERLEGLYSRILRGRCMMPESSIRIQEGAPSKSKT
jgi:methionine synthase II (cobalamin-independent)